MNITFADLFQLIYLKEIYEKTENNIGLFLISGIFSSGCNSKINHKQGSVLQPAENNQTMDKTAKEKTSLQDIIDAGEPNNDSESPSRIDTVIKIDGQIEGVEEKLKSKKLSGDERITLEQQKISLQNEKEFLLLENKKIKDMEQREELKRMQNPNLK